MPRLIPCPDCSTEIPIHGPGNYECPDCGRRITVKIAKPGNAKVVSTVHMRLAILRMTIQGPQDAAAPATHQ